MSKFVARLENLFCEGGHDGGRDGVRKIHYQSLRSRLCSLEGRSYVTQTAFALICCFAAYRGTSIRLWLEESFFVSPLFNLKEGTFYLLWFWPKKSPKRTLWRTPWSNPSCAPWRIIWRYQESSLPKYDYYLCKSLCYVTPKINSARDHVT